GVENERDAKFGELPAILEHRLVTVRPDDAETDPLDVPDVVFIGAHHRPGMEGGDLVVVQVGGDEGLGGIEVRDLLDVVQADAAGLEMLPVWAEVLPDRRHRY